MLLVRAAVAMPSNMSFSSHAKNGFLVRCTLPEADLEERLLILVVVVVGVAVVVVFGFFGFVGDRFLLAFFFEGDVEANEMNLSMFFVTISSMFSVLFACADNHFWKMALMSEGEHLPSFTSSSAIYFI